MNARFFPVCLLCCIMVPAGVFVAVETPATNDEQEMDGVLMIVLLFSPDGSQDGLSMSNYANIQIKYELARLHDVSGVALLGDYDYGLRIRLDRKKMAAHKLNAGDIVRELDSVNGPMVPPVVDIKVSLDPMPRGQIFEYKLNTRGHPVLAEYFAEIILNVDSEGHIVFLKDVAHIERDRVRRQRFASFNGKPVAALIVRRIGEVSPRKLRAAIRGTLSDLRKRLPTGLDFAVTFDFTANLEKAERTAMLDYLLLEMHLPIGASEQRVLQVVQRCQTLVRQVPAVQGVLALSENPFDLFSNAPCILVRLKAAKKRKSSREEVARAIRGKLDEIKEMKLRLRNLWTAGSRLPGRPTDGADHC